MAIPSSIIRDVVKGATSAVGNVANKTASTVSGGSTSAASTPRAGDMVSSTVTYKDPVTGKTISVNPASSGGYMDAYNTYYASTEKEAKDREAYLDKVLGQNNAQTNSNYDSAARQAYVQYMQRQRALPSQLQALGVNGGATESGLLNLYNNYGNVHASNEQQRNAELAANQQSRDDDWQAYMTALEEDRRDQLQTALNNQMNEYKNNLTIFKAGVARYPTTRKGYEQYQTWLKNMKASKDPLKDVKAAYIEAQMATQFPEGAPKEEKKGGGGGGRSRGRSRGGSGSGSGRSGGGSGSWESAAKNASDAFGRVASRYTRSGGGSFARGIARGSTSTIARGATGYRWTR